MEKKEKGIIKNSLIISIVVTIGKVLGFVKQSIIAWAFGASTGTDIFFSADGYTSMFGQIMMQSIGPTVLTHYVAKEKEAQEEATDFIRACLILFPFLGLVIALISVFLSNQIVSLIGISYSTTQKTELQFFLIILCPVIVFTSITGVIQGYLDAINHFVPAKLCSLFFSISIVLSVLLFHKQLGVRSLLFGFIAGYALHTLYMSICIFKRIKWRFVNPFGNPYIKRMMKKFLPIVIGTSVVDLGHLIDRIVASSLVMGSVSVLYYSQVISNDIVNAVVITSLGTVLLPMLAKKVTTKNTGEELIQIISKIINSMSYVLLLITILYIIEGEDLIKLFFEHGNFTHDNTVEVTHVACFYAIGFIFLGWREIFIKAHYAYHDTFMPMVNSIVGVVINLIGNVVLSKYIGVAGIAISTSVSMIVVAILSSLTLKRHTIGLPINRKGVINLLKLLFACILTTVFSLCIRAFFCNLNYIIRLFLMSSITLVIYITITILTRENTIMMVMKKGDD